MTYYGRSFDKFILVEREKNIKLIRHRYSLSIQEAEDIVSDAIADLYASLASGKDKDTMTSMSAYFTKMCLNKSFKHAQALSRKALVRSLDDDVTTRQEADRVNSFLNSVEDMSEDVIKIMRQIVADLPAPCDKILWGYYEDGMSMKEIAIYAGLKDDMSAKSTKSNCISKLKTRYIKLLQSIKNGEI